MGSLVAILVGLAPMSADGATPHGHRLAPESFRLVLDLEVTCPPGRPKTTAEIRDLIRRMSHANPLWGAPRVHGELLKLGIEVAQSTVAKYLRRHRKPPMQTWRTFLTNHTTSLPFRPQHSGFCLSSPCCRRLDAAWCTSV